MFKGFKNASMGNSFNGFPNLNFNQNSVEAYGFSGCVYWLDASYGTNTVTDLAAVSSWTERVRGHKFSQATAGNQPRYIASDINGYPSVEFQSAARYMSGQPVPFGQNYTIVNVFKKIGTGAYQWWLSNGTYTPLPYGVAIGGTNATGVGFTWAYNETTQYSGSYVEDSNPHIGLISSNDLVVDGASTGTATMAGNRYGDLTLNFLGNPDFSTGPQIRSAEMLIYNQRLTSSQMIALSANLNLKYAIY
jgi:hypothetical protein